MKKNGKKRGFTIVELVVVIAIIGVLASVTIVGFTEALSNAKEKAALLEARNIYAEYQVDAADSGDTPITDCVIKVDDFNFEVSDGKISDESATFNDSELVLAIEGNGNIYKKK